MYDCSSLWYPRCNYWFNQSSLVCLVGFDLTLAYDQKKAIITVGEVRWPREWDVSLRKSLISYHLAPPQYSSNVSQWNYFSKILSSSKTRLAKNDLFFNCFFTDVYCFAKVIFLSEENAKTRMMEFQVTAARNILEEEHLLRSQRNARTIHSKSWSPWSPDSADNF